MQKKRIIEIAVVAMILFSILIQLQIDSLVHNTLYNYGLIFSADWANQYWILQRLNLILLTFAVLLIAVAIITRPRQLKKVEDFLSFFLNPFVYCFKCGKKFLCDSAKTCSKCGWLICPHCKTCRCLQKRD